MKPVRALLAVAAVLSLTIGAVPLADGRDFDQPPFDPPVAGAEAIDRFSASLATIAARYDMDAAELVHLLGSDPNLHVDRDGFLLYVDPPGHEHDDDDLVHHTGAEHDLAEMAYTDADTFKLHSKPGSQRTIYLDFDGHTVSGTVWNGGEVPNGYQALPFNTDGDAGSFSSAEQAVIRAVWARVAEDFTPFDVNVTTEDPGPDAITRSGTSDQIYGTRLVVTHSPSSHFCGSGCGGVAYVGVFNRTSNHAYYQPAWCFAGSLGSSAKQIAECASHEVGHNLGLHHDGITDGTAYYSGHSPWAPIMGVGYNQPVSQWSKGEYTSANNKQDDLHVMTAYGILIRADDHGDSTATASLLTGTATGIISTQTDRDYFRFVPASSGTATFSAVPAGVGPNLDIRLTLYGQDGAQLAQSNPTVSRANASVATGLDASIAFPVVPAQPYFIRVEGASHGTGATGYTEYASLGAYTVRVEGVAGVLPGANFGVVDRTQGVWYLLDPLTWDTTTFYYGNPGDYPIMGDWDCDGIDTPGLYRQSDGFVYLRNSNSQGNADIRFYFGNPGDIPIVGDFNDNGCDTVSIYRPSQQTFYVINKLGANDGGLGAADFSFLFGNPGDKPFSGDFNNDGITEIGLHRESTGLVYYRNTLTTGVADAQFIYGNPGDRIVSGQWSTNGGNGPETVGVFRPSQGTIFLRYTNSAGVADLTQKYGNANMWPVSGDFGPLPGGGSAPPN